VIWQVTSRSSEMGFPGRVRPIHVYRLFYRRKCVIKKGQSTATILHAQSARAQPTVATRPVAYGFCFCYSFYRYWLSRAWINAPLTGCIDYPVHTLTLICGPWRRSYGGTGVPTPYPSLSGSGVQMCTKPPLFVPCCMQADFCNT